MASNRFRFDEVWEIPEAPPARVWAVLADAELLPDWWGDVYREVQPLARGAANGLRGRARARARGAPPYELNFEIEAVEMIPGALVSVRTTGDFVGLWTARLSPDGAGTRVDLSWEVIVERPVLKFLAPLLRPAFAWNHRRTTPRGEAGLRRYLAARAAAPRF